MKNKGFTLIELLAVIVILAVIALIVTPIVTSIISQAKDSANARSVEGHIKGVEYNILEISFKDSTNMNKYDGTYPNNNVNLLTKLASDGVNLQSNDNIDCESYTVVNGTITSASGCTETGWNKTYNYTNTGGAVVSGSGSNNQNSTPIAIGTSIDYSTTLNGVTLNNWKVFYVEGNYTYLILSDLLPSSVELNVDYITQCESNDDPKNCRIDVWFDDDSYYSDTDSWSSDTVMVDALLNEENWDSLLQGTLNGTVNINETSNTNAYAIGSPTAELFMNSWNQTYPDEQLVYTTEDRSEWYDKTVIAFSIGTNNDNLNTDENLLNTSGHSNTLYFPTYYDGQAGLNYYEGVNGGTVNGYWLSSYSIDSSSEIDTMTQVISYTGATGGCNPGYGDYGIRPVIKLPTSVLNQ